MNRTPLPRGWIWTCDCHWTTGPTNGLIAAQELRAGHIRWALKYQPNEHQDVA